MKLKHIKTTSRSSYYSLYNCKRYNWYQIKCLASVMTLLTLTLLALMSLVLTSLALTSLMLTSLVLLYKIISLQPSCLYKVPLASLIILAHTTLSSDCPYFSILLSNVTEIRALHDGK